MTEKTKNRRGSYTEEFKADAVRLVIDEELPVAHVARDLGMHPNTLHGWVNKVRSEVVQCSSSSFVQRVSLRDAIVRTKFPDDALLGVPVLAVRHAAAAIERIATFAKLGLERLLTLVILQGAE